ncbi:MAG: VIT1/CCC1 transporter family protein [Patescibacteria group bacterium]|nr:VIT1/CCC1 transporter family protein [Patescibacteria group bacterium]
MPKRNGAGPATHDEADRLQRSVSGAYLGNFILGANDGLVTTFAVVAGASGAKLTAAIVIIFGLANLLADGMSMGLGNYLGRRSELDYHRRQRQHEHDEVERFPGHEAQEVREAFQRWGFSGPRLEEAVQTITNDKKRWVDFMMRQELHIIENQPASPARQGLVTFAAFVAIGIIPILPYFVGLNGTRALWSSALLTAGSLFAVGASRSAITVQKWYWGGVQMLLVGGSAAAVAYLVGFVMERFVGATI